MNDAMASARGGMEEPYDGVAELWWESEAAIAAAGPPPRGQRAGAELLADEAEFIDLPTRRLWLAYEYPQVNPSPENVVARPKSADREAPLPAATPGGHDASTRPSGTGAPATVRSSDRWRRPWACSATNRCTATRARSRPPCASRAAPPPGVHRSRRGVVRPRRSVPARRPAGRAARHRRRGHFIDFARSGDLDRQGARLHRPLVAQSLVAHRRQGRHRHG